MFKCSYPIQQSDDKLSTKWKKYLRKNSTRSWCWRLCWGESAEIQDRKQKYNENNQQHPSVIKELLQPIRTVYETRCHEFLITNIFGNDKNIIIFRCKYCIYSPRVHNM